MNLLFLAAALVMSLLALPVIARPLLKTSRASSKGVARLPLLVGIVAIVFAIGMYGLLGSPDIASSNSQAKVASTNTSISKAAATKNDGVASVSSLVTGLEERLKNEPDDAKGWLLLAKTYQHLGRDQEAESAYDKAVALGQTDNAFAESLTATSAPATSVAEIRGRVGLSEAAMAMVRDDDTVFIFAKAVNGPPMPLAVIRRPVTELPFEFVLSDAQSMVQGNGLSSVEQVIVTAKITASRDALNNDPALVTHSDPVATIDTPYLGLTIGPAAISNEQ